MAVVAVSMSWESVIVTVCEVVVVVVVVVDVDRDPYYVAKGCTRVVTSRES